MQGHAPLFLRIFLPFVLVFCLFLIFVPSTAQAFLPGPTPPVSTKIGPKAYYLTLGDSLAFGYQPDLDFVHGYADDFYANLKNYGVKNNTNLACAGETSTTFIKGGCAYAFLQKYTYAGSQLKAAEIFLQQHAGQVSPVTLDIGANDLLPDLNPSTCAVSARWTSDLANVNANLTKIILPALLAAMTVHGQVTGDILLMDDYDPYQDVCPNTKAYVEQINKDLAQDIQATRQVFMVDIFGSFSGSGAHAVTICSYTWICSHYKDVHGTDLGYNNMATAFELAAGY